MPVMRTYPGVYVEEQASQVQTITGVGTSVTAFVGFTGRGPVNKAVQVFNFGDYEREFGTLTLDSEVSYSVRQFFLNGGSNAWVVRVVSGARKAALTLASPEPALAEGGQAVLEV